MMMIQQVGEGVGEAGHPTEREGEDISSLCETIDEKRTQFWSGGGGGGAPGAPGGRGGTVPDGRAPPYTTDGCHGAGRPG